MTIETNYERTLAKEVLGMKAAGCPMPAAATLLAQAVMETPRSESAPTVLGAGEAHPCDMVIDPREHTYADTHGDKVELPTPRTDAQLAATAQITTITPGVIALATLARQLERELSSARSADGLLPQGSYEPLTREVIEVWRKHWNNAPRFTDDAVDPHEVRELNRLCDMAISSLLYAQEIERLRTQSASERTAAWLIEMPAARWGTGYCWKGVGDFNEWGSIEEAVRFARKEDADRVISSLTAEGKRRNGSRHDLKLEACEHFWENATNSPSDSRSHK